MISERSVSSAACSESASRTGGPSSAIRSMPGIQPTVETPMFEWAMPTSGSRSQAASTLSRFMSGSPMPMNTAWESRASPGSATGAVMAPVALRGRDRGPRRGLILRRKWSAWSRISEAVRLRPKRIVAVAQKVHVSGQPDWLDAQSERRPSR